MTRAPLNRRSIALQVRDDIRQRMTSGEFPLGAQLPSESECCTEYGVSRATVREAYRLLEQEGLVGTRQGSGRYVIADMVKRSEGLVSVFRSLTEYLAEQGYDTEIKVESLNTRPATIEEAQLLETIPGEEIVDLKRIRYYKGHPIVYSTNKFLRSLTPDDLDDIDWTRSIIAIFDGFRKAPVSSVADVEATLLPEDFREIDNNGEVAWLRVSGPAFNNLNQIVWWSEDLMRSDVRAFRIINNKNTVNSELS